MIETWILVTLAALGSWDIIRRLLPVRVPTVAGKIIIVLLAWLLIRCAARDIVIALAVPGTLILVSGIMHPEPHTPWGPYLREYMGVHRHAQKRHRQQPAPPPRIGHRLPRI